MRDLSRKPRSRAPSPLVIVGSDKSRYDADDYRFTTLEPNQIFMEDGLMDEEERRQLAFSLGMPMNEGGTPTADTKRFVHKLKQRKTNTQVPIDDLLEALLLPIRRAHDTIDFKADAPFWREAIPQEVKDSDTERGWRMQLPTPKPAFTFGYRRHAFRQRYHELQNGIIDNEYDEPCNLAQVSQPVPDIYWPFLVIESRPSANPEAMGSAKHACAGAAATCNNAIMMLSNAAQRPNEYSTSPSLQWDTLKLAQTFSLAIDGRIACLSSHNSQGVLPHSMMPVRLYNLEDQGEVQALCSRIESILVWAEHSRLLTILEVLDRLDRRVHSGVPSQTPLKADFGKDVWHDGSGQWGESSGGLRMAFKDRFSSVARAIRLKAAS
jgi:hypothetical protein